MQLTKEMGGELKHTFRKAGLSNEQFSQGGLSYSSMFRSIDSANDLRALFIKPMACCYLSLHHAGRALYELALTLLHLLTLSRADQTCTHFDKLLDSLIKSCAYAVWCCAVLCSEALTFTMRCMMSLGLGMHAIATGFIGMFNPSMVHAIQVVEAEVLHS